MTVPSTFLSDRKVLCVSLALLGGTLIVNSIVPVLPVSELTFILVALVIWFVSLCVTFIGLHKLVQLKEPIPNSVFSKYLAYLGVSYAPVHNEKATPPKLNIESVKRLTLDIDKYFISKWYCNISKDPDFVVESKTFLEEVLTRLLEVVLRINSTCVLHGLLNISLKHLKEFRRSLKRKEKYNVEIQQLYRYSHICSVSSNKKSKEYFIHRLTVNVLQHFINSELWNSLPCHILVSILARKLICYLLNMLSNPEVLNYIILNSLASNEAKEKLKLDQYGRISVIEFFDVIDNNSKINKTRDKDNKIITKDEEVNKKSEELQAKVEEAAQQYKKLDSNKSVKEKDPRDAVVLRHRNKQIALARHNAITKSPKKSSPVKIYEPKNTVRTWRDSRDLACVSLGQDPLDIELNMLTGPTDGAATSGTKQEPGETSGKEALMESVPYLNSTKSDDTKHDSPTSATHLFNEVINMTSMEGLKTSMKPLSDATERTLHNIKDLQEATVHNALHKIGDFQDEAAGMVEGILDFGMAGFRKGLRLTGLQDNIENAKTTISNNSSAAKNVTKSMREQVKKKLEDLKRLDSDSQDKMSSAESADSVWINPLQIDSPIYDGNILLEKTPNKRDDADSNQPPRIEDLPIPSISTEDASSTDSPDPEYEDTADLASSIAKLRSLLQQRSSESSLSTPALSPMPDEYLKQMESEGTSDVEALEVDGVMPSFYKFCTKTASGVFSNTLNTIKTALPGNNAENVYAVELWKFTANQQESDILIKMKKLLSERKEYCILDKEIDTAYDALDSVDIFQQSPILLASLPFEDELDDFESKIPITKTIIDIFCELLADTNSPLIQEPIVKAILLQLGHTIERKVTSLLDGAKEYLAENLFNIPETSNTNVLSMDIDDYIDSIDYPDAVKYLLGKENFKSALKLLISSLQRQKINEDVLLQGFELIAMKLIEESIQVSPPASA